MSGGDFLSLFSRSNRYRRTFLPQSCRQNSAQPEQSPQRTQACRRGSRCRPRDWRWLRIVVPARPRFCSSSGLILSTRRAWRPPSNGVLSQISIMRSISRSPSRSAERQSTFESLWRRLISAVRSSWQGAGAHAGHLIRGDAHAQARPAHQNPAVHLVVAHLVSPRRPRCRDNRPRRARTCPRRCTSWPSRRTNSTTFARISKPRWSVPMAIRMLDFKSGYNSNSFEAAFSTRRESPPRNGDSVPAEPPMGSQMSGLGATATRSARRPKATGRRWPRGALGVMV